MVEKQTDILIVGGGVGGCAAAMAATSLGNRVVMTEQTSWIGGQLTSQAVPPDEHRWIEHFGCTRRYRAYRDGVRRYYHDHFPLTTHARAIPNLNPGMGRVSRLSHDFRVGVAVLEQMLAFERSAGLLEVMLGRKPVAVETEGDQIRAVTLRNLDTQEDEVVCFDYVIDATELGDLLALAGIEYVSGAESQDQTGEPHAVSGPPQPDNVQAMTWCFPLAFDPEGSHVIDKPEQFERWRYYVPDLKPAWSGRLFSWVHPRVPHLRPWTRCLFDDETDDPAAALWNYRRIHYGGHYPESIAPHEVSVINWPQNDYLEGNIIDRPADEVERYLEEARQLSLSLIYWIQTEAPRPDGGVGYPGLYLRPDLVGTDDGLAMFPYIRESRRIKALFTVTENHVGFEARQARRAERFEDSVGIGCYRIDLHPSTGGDNYIDISSLPFQIPLGALLPVRARNLLPACKNVGTTHISNGCYRLHPVEWNIGEAAGLIAAFCLGRRVSPHQVRETGELLSDFQSLLVKQGVELEWPSVGPV